MVLTTSNLNARRSRPGLRSTMNAVAKIRTRLRNSTAMLPGAVSWTGGRTALRPRQFCPSDLWEAMSDCSRRSGAAPTAPTRLDRARHGERVTSARHRHTRRGVGPGEAASVGIEEADGALPLLDNLVSAGVLLGKRELALAPFGELAGRDSHGQFAVAHLYLRAAIERSQGAGRLVPRHGTGKHVCDDDAHRDVASPPHDVVPQRERREQPDCPPALRAQRKRARLAPPAGLRRPVGRVRRLAERADPDVIALLPALWAKHCHKHHTFARERQAAQTSIRPQAEGVSRQPSRQDKVTAASPHS